MKRARSLLSEIPWPGFLLTGIVYLVFWAGTTPLLEYDAGMYWQEAHVFINDGFRNALLHTFTAREPGYALFVYAVSRFFPDTHLLKAVVFLQFLLLFICALLTYDISKSISKNRLFHLTVFFAVALSPALTATAQTFYSESVSMFFFTLNIYFFWRWHSAAPEEKGAWFYLIVSAIAGGVLSICRAAFMHIYLLSAVLLFAAKFLLPSVKQSALKPHLLIVYFATIISFPYLWMVRNEKAHGIFNMTEHSGIILRGRYEKSLEPYSFRDVAAGTANSISESVCRSLFGNCDKFPWVYAGNLGAAAAQRVMTEEHCDSRMANHILFRQTLKEIFTKHPVRFFAFGWFEICQLLFFETLSTGAVQVNSKALFFLNSPAVRGLLHLGLSTFYVAGLGSFLLSLFKRGVSALDVAQRRTLVVLGVPFFSFFVVYSMASTVIRYTFVVAPVYILFSWAGIFCVTKSFRGEPSGAKKW